MQRIKKERKKERKKEKLREQVVVCLRIIYHNFANNDARGSSLATLNVIK